MTNPRRSRVRDYVIYVSIAFLVVLIIILKAELGVDRQGFIKWFGLGSFSVFIYGVFIADNRDTWKTKRFWAATIAVLAVHFVGFIFLLTHVHYWRLIWFMPMFFELPVLMKVTAYIHHGQISQESSLGWSRPGVKSRLTLSLPTRAAYGHFVQLDGRHAYTHGDALAVFAAGAYALIQL
jgi:hypothetical protein